MSTSNTFSESEWLRYGRHIQLPKLGAEGQAKLKRARVLIIGAGGLGSPVALYLAAAGIGHIDLVDDDTVELSNLQRQILFSEANLGESKAEAGCKNLQSLNSDISVNAHNIRIRHDQGQELIARADIVIDCCDNLETRYAVNEHCIATKTPWVYASIHQFAGQLAVFRPDQACFECLFPTAPEQSADCNTAGVLGVLPGLLGCMQANEALKVLLNLGDAQENTLVLFDALSLSLQKIQFAKREQCSACSGKSSLRDVSSPVCYSELESDTISVEDFENLDLTQYTLIDVRGEAEHQGFNLGGRLIPLNQLEASLPSLDKQLNFLCYCQVGMRSSAAAKSMRDNGFKAFSLAGGVQAILEFRSKLNKN